MQRTREEKALEKVHAHRKERRGFLRCLDAFGDDVDVERVGQRPNRADDRSGFVLHAGNERFVDFEGVDRERA